MLSDIKVVHLESTDVCQLSCPLCARELDKKFNKKEHNHLNISQIEKHLSIPQIKNLDKMFMCGNYGDPAAGKHTLEIYQWFRNINPTITLGMNTNGGLQTTEWWRTLASIFNQNFDYVVFSIDGLGDTNHIYRKNANWDKIVKNAETFINAGGIAHWDMLVYKHNQHQVEECMDFAKSLGFKWFRAKVSKRPLIDNLQYPDLFELPETTTGKINCHALREKSIYITAKGNLKPCCWLGSDYNDFVTVDQVSSTWYSDDPNTTCQKSCGTSYSKTNFENQWRWEVNF